MTYLRNTLCALALVLYGCGDDDTATATATDPGMDPGSAQPDAATPMSPTPMSPPATTTTTTTTPGAIPLVDWIDDLIDHHTDDNSAPDTVHDKNIIDNKNPATFAKRFRR